MIVTVLKLVHSAAGSIAIGLGIWVLLGLLAGKLFNRFAVVFLRCALIASVTGLLFPFQNFLPTDRVAMITVYVAGLAVLSWRRYHLAGVWALLFALSIISVLFLDLLVVIAHVFAMLIPSQPNQWFLTAESLVILLFIGLCLSVVKRYRDAHARPAATPHAKAGHGPGRASPHPTHVAAARRRSPRSGCRPPRRAA